MIEAAALAALYWTAVSAYARPDAGRGVLIGTAIYLIVLVYCALEQFATREKTGDVLGAVADARRRAAGRKPGRRPRRSARPHVYAGEPAECKARICREGLCQMCRLGETSGLRMSADAVQNTARSETISHMTEKGQPARSRHRLRVTGFSALLVGLMGFAGIGFLVSGDPTPGETTHAPAWASRRWG
jgi:hypothetical protein